MQQLPTSHYRWSFVNDSASDRQRSSTAAQSACVSTWMQSASSSEAWALLPADLALQDIDIRLGGVAARAMARRHPGAQDVRRRFARDEHEANAQFPRQRAEAVPLHALQEGAVDDCRDIGEERHARHLRHTVVGARGGLRGVDAALRAVLRRESEQPLALHVGTDADALEPLQRVRVRRSTCRSPTVRSSPPATALRGRLRRSARAR